MSTPLVVKCYHHIAATPDEDLDALRRKKALPAHYLLDNRILYGEYPLIGHRALGDDELDFPMSYTADYKARDEIYLQWGLIHKRLKKAAFDRCLQAENPFLEQDNPNRITPNPYCNEGVGLARFTQSPKRCRAPGGFRCLRSGCRSGLQRQPGSREFIAFPIKTMGKMNYQRRSQSTQTVQCTLRTVLN